MKGNREKSGYEVGKGKPPKETRFKKGQSGNLSGRPQGVRNTKTLLRELLGVVLDRQNPLTEQVESLTTEQLMHMAQIAKAIKDGDTRAYEAVLDRIDGKPTQTIANDPDNPFTGSGDITLVFNTEKIEPVTSEAAMQAIFEKFKEE